MVPFMGRVVILFVMPSGSASMRKKSSGLRETIWWWSRFKKAA